MNHRNYTLLLLLSLLWASTSLFGQGWIRTYPEGFGSSVAFDVKPSSDGGYVLAGETDYPTGAIRHYIRLIKTDADGVKLWDKVYGAGDIANDGAREVWPTTDGGYAIVGSRGSNNNINVSAMLLLRTNALGDTLWSRTYSGGNGATLGYASYPTADGGYILAGEFHPVQSTPGPVGGIVVKTNANGDQEWVRIYTSGNSPNFVDGLRDIRPTADGGYIAAGHRGNQVLVLRLDAAGDTIWTRTLPLTTGSRAYTVTPTADGGFVVGGSADGFAGAGPQLIKLDADGNEVWNGILSIDLGAIAEIEELSDGNFIATGSLVDYWTNSPGLLSSGFIAKIGADGIQIWLRHLNGENNISAVAGYIGASVLPIADGGFVVAGRGLGDAMLTKATADGFSVSNWIMGNVYRSTSCLTDDIIGHMSGWKVKLDAGNQTRYTLTDADGNYSFLVDTGTYTLEVIPPNVLWANCTGAVTFQLTNFYDTTFQNMQVAALADCPLMTVDVGTNLLRRCVNNTYHVTYCNDGTSDATNAYVDVTLDPFLNLVSADLPYVQLAAHQYRFAVGDVAIGDCGTFALVVFLNCVSTTPNQTHCVTAHIYPDSLCIAPTPTAAIIDVQGQCLGNTVRFTLRNVSQVDMQGSSQYIVIEDDVMYMTQPFDLDAGEMIDVDIPANGSTYRLETELSPGNIGFNSQLASATVEGCGTNAGGVFSTGFFNLFPLNDNTPFEDIDCRPSVASFDPNDKQAFPVGYGDPHYIRANTPIEYLIRFQNTGNDTAFVVSVKDTLSPWLDPGTIQPGTASHPYRWDLSGAGVLTFYFDNILLSDSNVNEAASQGFVRFTVQQRADNPLGTVIENNAAIYFDYNAPVITNTTYHTIGENFVTVSYEPGPAQAPYNLAVFPNPAGSHAQLRFEGPQQHEGQWRLYDARGQLQQSGTPMENDAQLDVSNLPKGLYFLEWRINGRRVAEGKLVVQ